MGSFILLFTLIKVDFYNRTKAPNLIKLLKLTPKSKGDASNYLNFFVPARVMAVEMRPRKIINVGSKTRIDLLETERKKFL